MRPCVFITGASSGIGKSIAMTLSDKYDLVINGRNRQSLDEVAAVSGNRCVVKVWEYDLSVVDDLQSAFETFVRKENVCLTHFVHCAGIAQPCAIRAVDVGSVRRMVDVNAVSAMLLMSSLMKRRIAADTMRAIVFISSLSANMGTAGSAVYGASKAMLDGFARSAAVELAPRVRVNTIRPGFVQSSMTESFLSFPKAMDAVAKRHPLGVGCVEDVARAVEFLLSDEARWITGQSVAVDGGASCDLTFK